MYDHRHIKGSKSYLFFRATLIIPKETLFCRLWEYEIDIFHVSCFITLFFLIELVLEVGIYCLFILVSYLVVLQAVEPCLM